MSREHRADHGDPADGDRAHGPSDRVNGRGLGDDHGDRSGNVDGGAR